MELKVELEDGYTPSGLKRRGPNRNRLKRVKDSYYINGLRLEADEEYGYGVVRRMKILTGWSIPTERPSPEIKRLSGIRTGMARAHHKQPVCGQGE